MQFLSLIHIYFDARRHLVQGERLGQVVIAAGAEPTDPFIHIRKRADQEDRRIDAVILQGGGDGEAIHARKHPIQGNGVVPARHAEPKALGAIGHMVDLKPAPRQLEEDFPRGGFVILDCQYLGQAAFFAGRGVHDRR